MSDALAIQFYVHRYLEEDDPEKAGEECISELALADNPGLLAELFARNTDHSGELAITSPGNPEVRIRDSLDALVMQLCFESLNNLIEEHHVVVRHYLMYGYIRLDPEGDLSLLSGDYVPKVRVNRAALIPALFQAGERYLELIRGLRRTNEEFDELLTMLEDYHTEAAEALRAFQG